MSEQTQSVLYATDERGVATVTLNRADVHNAFDEEMIAELTRIFRQVEQ